MTISKWRNQQLIGLSISPPVGHAHWQPPFTPQRTQLAYYFHGIDPGIVCAEDFAATMPIKVAIVDDDREVREGLGFLIDASPGFQCVARCRTAEEALEEVPRQQPDVVLMDIGLPGISGIDCVRQLRVKAPSAQITMLTAIEEPDKLFRSLAAGAKGYLVKSEDLGKVLEAIQDLHAGGSPMSSQIARRVVETFQEPKLAKGAADVLSKREREIIQFLKQGLIYKEIAEKTGISVETVRTHIRNIYDKLEVRSRTEAINKAFRQ